MLALGVSSASAAMVFPSLGQISGPSSVSTFSELSAGSVAVDNANGHILVADSGTGLVYDFVSASDTSPTIWNGSSTPAGSFGGGPVSVAVDNASGDIYVGDRTHAVVDKFDSSGNLIASFGDTSPAANGQLAGSATPAGSFSPASGAGSTLGIAVDQATGDLYVIDAGHQVVDIFSSSGSYLSQITATPAGLYGCGNQYADGIAVNPTSGHVFVADSCSDQVFEFDSAGSYVTTWTGAGTPAGSFGGGYVAVAVDDSSGDVYVMDTSDNVVDQFDSSGSYLAQITGIPSAPSNDGVAVDEGTGNVYVSANVSVSTAEGPVTNGSVKIFGPAVLVPDVTTGSASNIGPTSAALSGTVNPDGTTVTDCHFDYVDDADYNASAANPYRAGGTAPCSSTPSGSSPVAVSANITGLTAGTTYHFRLQASNANGANYGADATFPTPPPPSIDSASATNLTSTSADLNAQINPSGYDTTYHFQYGTSIGYGTTVPVPDADIGSGTGDVPVTQHVGGLSANTTYHWRVVATSANGTTTGVDHTFVYDTSGQGLPDGRVYELVTPPNKSGALIGNIFTGLLTDFSGDGSRVIASSIQCFADARSCTGIRGEAGSVYEFTRTGAGWVTSSMTPPATQYQISTAWNTSADGATALFSAPTQPGGEDDFYARQPDGSFTHIGPVSPPSAGAEGPVGLGAPLATTADLSRVVWQPSNSAQPPWPFDTTLPNGDSVYEYAGAGAQPVLVGVSGGPGSTDLISVCGTVLGNGNTTSPQGTLSADGSIVYFTARGKTSGNESAACLASSSPAADALYARVDGTSADARTVLISQRSPADCTTAACTGSPPGNAYFEGASRDGSQAFFATTQQLTDNASEDSAAADSAANGGCFHTTGPNGCNLYLYDFQPAGRARADRRLRRRHKRRRAARAGRGGDLSRRLARLLRRPGRAHGERQQPGPDRAGGRREPVRVRARPGPPQWADHVHLDVARHGRAIVVERSRGAGERHPA